MPRITLHITLVHGQMVSNNHCTTGNLDYRRLGLNVYKHQHNPSRKNDQNPYNYITNTNSFKISQPLRKDLVQIGNTA